eukprot:11212168-Lingulodinium_polyedra.AAC.2
MTSNGMIPPLRFPDLPGLPLVAAAQGGQLPAAPAPLPLSAPGPPPLPAPATAQGDQSDDLTMDLSADLCALIDVAEEEARLRSQAW